MRSKVELLPAISEDGLRLALAPLGTPDSDKDTDCADPEVTALEMVLLTDEPDARVRAAGLETTEKSLLATPVKVKGSTR